MIKNFSYSIFQHFSLFLHSFYLPFLHFFCMVRVGSQAGSPFFSVKVRERVLVFVSHSVQGFLPYRQERPIEKCEDYIIWFRFISSFAVPSLFVPRSLRMSTSWSSSSQTSPCMAVVGCVSSATGSASGVSWPSVVAYTMVVHTSADHVNSVASKRPLQLLFCHMLCEFWQQQKTTRLKYKRKTKLTYYCCWLFLRKYLYN